MFEDAELRITSTSKSGIDFIKRWEGFRSKPYRCQAGVATIGYGATYYEDGRRVAMTDSEITEVRAEMLLANLLKTYEKAVDSFTRDDLNQFQFDALVSFCYNVGVQALKDSTLLKKVNLDPNDKLISKEFMKWVNANKKRSEGLVKRRQKEAEYYFQ